MALPGGSTAGLIVGVGVGAAAGAALEPAVEIERQAAWQGGAVKLPDVGLIAALVAGGKVTQTDGRHMANRLGFSNGTFDSVTWLAQNRLDFPALLRMWRLAAVNPSFDEATLSALLDRTLAHEQLDWDYRPALRALRTAELPGIGDIAFAVVRGILPSPAYVPVAPGTGGKYVKAFPQLNIDPEKLAAALGYDPQMLELLVGRSGLSMAPVMAANALFRTTARLELANLPAITGIGPLDLTPVMDSQDYLLAIGQGDLRTNYAAAVRSTARQVLTAGEYAELQLRGWIDEAQRRALAKQHGMSEGDSDLQFRLHRRPLNVHAITQALAKGATFNPEPGELTDPYEASVHQANLGPEWYSLAIANKYVVPSAFVIRALLKDGVFTAAEGTTLLEHSGWSPDIAGKVATHYAANTTAAADPHVTKAQTTAWTKAQSSYIAQEATATDVAPIFATLGIPAAAQTEITHIWDEVRALRRKQLTPAQVKKAWVDLIPNPATGQPWTQAEAHAALVARGYSDADATVFLAE